MKSLIIEDEKAAVRNLTAILTDVAPEIEIIGAPDSVADAIEWFASNPMPELVFMDIHLADGSAFEIFEHIQIKCPVIFTTAYDEYALRAFKVNSIDYLLKPINEQDVRAAVHLRRPCDRDPDRALLDHLRPAGKPAARLIPEIV